MSLTWRHCLLGEINMEKYIFTIREDKLEFYGEKSRIVYGIDIWQEKANIRYCVRSIPDIFFVRKKAENFVAFCNNNDVSLIHIDDIIEDLF